MTSQKQILALFTAAAIGFGGLTSVSAQSGAYGSAVNGWDGWSAGGIIAQNPAGSDDTIKLADEAAVFTADKEYTGALNISAEIYAADGASVKIEALDGCGEISGTADTAGAETGKWIKTQIQIIPGTGEYTAVTDGIVTGNGTSTGYGVSKLRFTSSGTVYINNISIEYLTVNYGSDMAQYILNTDFTKGTDGASIQNYDGWKYDDSESKADALGIKYGFAEAPDGSTALKLERFKDFNDGVTGAMRAMKTISENRTIITETQLYIPSEYNGAANNPRYGLFLRDSASAQLAALDFNNGAISLYIKGAGSSSYKNAYPYDRWFDVRLECSLETQTVNLYIDSKRINTAPIGFAEKVTGFTECDFELARWTKSVMYAKNISCYTSSDESKDNTNKHPFSNTLFSTDFSGTADASINTQNGWKIENTKDTSVSYTYAAAPDAASSGNTALKADRNASGSSANRLVRTLSDADGDIRISQRMYRPSTYSDGTHNYGFFTITARAQDGTTQTNLAQFYVKDWDKTNGRIAVNGKDIEKAFPQDKWFTMSLSVNMSAHTYDIYIDGSKVTTVPGTFADTVTEFTLLEYDISRYNPNGLWYVDDMTLKTRGDGTSSDDMSREIYGTDFKGTSEDSINGFEGWSVDRYGGATISYCFDEKDGNTAVRLEHSGDASSARRMTRNLGTDKDLLISQLVYMPSQYNGSVNGGIFNVFLRDQDAKPTNNLLSMSKGTLTCGGYKASYPQDKWFKLEILLHTKENTYDVYADGAKVNSSPMALSGSTVTLLSSLEYEMQRWAPGAAYMTRVSIRTQPDKTLYKNEIERDAVNYFEITDVSFTKASEVSPSPSDGCSTEIKLTEWKNSYTGEARAFAAAYDSENRLTALALKPLDRNDRNTAWSLTADDFNCTGAEKVKVFVFSDSMEPLAAAYTAGAACTIWVAGDSIAANYSEKSYPQTGWGMKLGNYFNNKLAAVENKAVGSRSSKTYIEQEYLQQIFDKAQPGDYLLISFGHNDRWKNATSGTTQIRYTDPTGDVTDSTSYKYWINQYVTGARERGMTPVLITSVPIYSFGSDGKIADLSGEIAIDPYRNAMREYAAENNVALIDLYNEIVPKINELGAENAKALWMIFTNAEYLDDTKFYGSDIYTDAMKNGGVYTDTTHFRAAGADMCARIIANGMKALKISEYLK